VLCVLGRQETRAFFKADAPRRPGALSPWIRLLLTLLLFCLASELGWADDCSSPEDAMDTIWMGPPLKGIISVIIAVAVNGQTILNQLLTLPGSATPEAQDAPPPELRLEVVTQDRRTDLTPGAAEGLWVYASIRARNAPPPLVGAAFSSISFSSSSGALALSGPQAAGSRRAVYVRAREPEGDAPAPSATLMVRAVLAGQPVAAPVVFTLGGGYALEIRTSSAWGSR
jgi:hypothetical protein